MKLDLDGRIKNTRLPRSKALLPVFEAVVNAFQAIEDLQRNARTESIEVVVHRDQALPDLGVDGHVDGFSVTDTGVGFNDANLDSFFTSDTQYKHSRGGKGIGRFIWLKAFARAEIESHFERDGKLVKRAFNFTTTTDQPMQSPRESMEKKRKTTVRLVNMKSPYKEHCPQGLELIGHQLVEHCLPFFMDPGCPRVTIRDDGARVDLNDYFKKFTADGTEHEFTVGEHTFTHRGLRLYNPHEFQHRLLYAANYREVVAEKLERFLANLRVRRLEEEDGRRFIYLGFIEGEYLNENVNAERTAFSFPVERTGEQLLDEPTLESIRTAALECVRSDLESYLEEINTEKRGSVSTYVSREAPEYGPLVRRHLDEIIDGIPPNPSPRTLEMALHEKLYEKQRELKSESNHLMDESAKEGLKPEEYEAKLNDFIERANELGKSSLAQYVAHRKVILEFLEKSLQTNPETGKYELEETIHRIIYPMRATSGDVPYEQQNLWIIDERLAYHEFLASDMPLASIEPLANDSRSRPDIMIFDRALSFAEDEDVLSSLVIVEFKKPARAEYGKEDPVDQVYRLIREIKAGHFKDKRGREIKVQSDRIPAYAYVICDATKEVEIVAQNKGMLSTPDNLGFYGYNPNLSAYVEIISYTKLLRDAKKRNRILFDKLNLPVQSS